MLFCNCRRSSNKVDPVLDTKHIVDWEAALINCQGDSDLLNQLFEYMKTGLSENSSEILKEYGSKNYKRVSEIAHKIKGDSASLACGLLNVQSAKLQKEPELQINISTLMKSVDQTLEVINNKQS